MLTGRRKATKRKKSMMGNDMESWGQLGTELKGYLKKIVDGACDNKWVQELAEQRLERAKFKSWNKRTLAEAADLKGWSGLEGECIKRHYGVFKGFLQWWHRERSLPVELDFEGQVLRSSVDYRRLHRVVYEFARQ